jgi:hypothetical protein
MAKKRNNLKAPKITPPRINVKNKVYNDLDEIDREELKKPYELQVFGMPKEHVEGMTMNQDDRVWHLRKDDFRDRILKADLMEYVDITYNSSINSISKQLAEVLDAHWSKTNALISELRTDYRHMDRKIDSIALAVSDLKCRIESVESKQLEDEAKIKELEILHEIPASVDERLKKVEGLKEWSETVNTYMSPKWTAVRIAAAVIFGSMLSLLLHSYFAESLHRFIQYLKP